MLWKISSTRLTLTCLRRKMDLAKPTTSFVSGADPLISNATVAII